LDIVATLGSQAVFHRIVWQFTCLPRFSGEPVEGHPYTASF